MDNNNNNNNNNNDNENWKKNLSFIHRRTPVRNTSIGKDNNNNNNNNKLSRHEDYFRDVGDHSLIFSDPALSIFDLSTPKYKMTPHENTQNIENNNNNNNNNISNVMTTPYWDNSIYKSTPETKIIDYMSNIQALDNESDINIHTPSRQSQPETPNSHETSSFLTKNVIKALNFGSSIDGDMSMILKETDESINELSEDDEDDNNNHNNHKNINNNHNNNNNKQQQNDNINSTNIEDSLNNTFEELKSELHIPTKDVSPDSAILKESELKGELLTKFSKNKLTSPLIHTKNNNIESIKSKEPIVSPNLDKEECEFTKHLTINLNTNENIHDISFVDALSNNITPITTTTTTIATTTRNNTNTNNNNSKQRIVDQNSIDKENRVNEQEPVEGLVDEWKETKTPQGKVYFYNRRTRQSVWKLPDDSVYIPTGNGAYRIFSSRKENKNDNNNTKNDNKIIDNHINIQSHPLVTPIKTESKVEDIKSNLSNTKISNPPVLQTPPRSRPSSNTHISNATNTTATTITTTNSSPRSGVAFLKKNDEVKLKNEKHFYCPLCGISIDIDNDNFERLEHKIEGHLNQCVTIDRKGTKTKNSDLQKLVVLQRSLIKIIDSMRNTTPTNFLPNYNQRDDSKEHTPKSSHHKNDNSNHNNTPNNNNNNTPNNNNNHSTLKRIEMESPPHQRIVSNSKTYDNSYSSNYINNQRLRSPSHDEKLIVLQPSFNETPVTVTANLSNPTGQHKLKKNDNSNSSNNNNNNLLSSTTPLTYHSRDTPRDEHRNHGKSSNSNSLYVCPTCTISLKNREDLVHHLQICPQISGDITSTRSDSYIVRSNLSTPNQKPIRLYHHDDGSIKKENHKSGSCPFCGKIPSSHNSLSSHLLSCQKKKESQERRESPLSKKVLTEKQSNLQRTPLTNRTLSPSPSSNNNNINRTQSKLDKSSSTTTTRGNSVPHISRIVPFR